MKANHHPNIIKKLAENNIGFECVSVYEVKYLRDKIKISNPILFTPNFCSIEEYVIAMKYDDINIIVDNFEIIKQNLDVFQNKKISLRIDLNKGDGHHINVITEGKQAKFGCPISHVINELDFLSNNNIKIIGLHSHSGSGINNYKNWVITATKLIKLCKYFNDIKWIDLGGGFGIDDENPIDFEKLNTELKSLDTDIDIYIEPGRFLVSEGGILLSKVNQIKKKENFCYVGLDTGMNSLIRPSLYGSYHKIHNITKINNERSEIYNIVGPICETGDIIGSNRLLPKSDINDIILIENTGAYGYVMSSNYNMRSPAEEIII
jgi:diaminopimelate decarboxylase/aspartate kinase